MPLNPSEAEVVSQALNELKSGIEKAYDPKISGVTPEVYKTKMEALNKQMSEINVNTMSAEEIGAKCRALNDTITQLPWHAPGTQTQKKYRGPYNLTTGVALVSFSAAIAKTSIKIPPRPTLRMPAAERTGTSPTGSPAKGNPAGRLLMEEMQARLGGKGPGLKPPVKNKN